MNPPYGCALSRDEGLRLPRRVTGTASFTDIRLALFNPPAYER